MNETNFTLSYMELTEALLKTQSPFQAAEVHGLLCGIICIAPEGSQRRWEKLAMGPKKNKHCADLLQQLYTASFHQMNEFSFEFTLVLPSDSIDLAQRTEALGLWCQGFLTGLQQAKTPITQSANTEVVEALDDLTEIAQVNYTEVTASNEDEASYFELVEYVRLAALMIYHELKTPSIANPLDDGNL
jgi:yecA family protein